MVGKMPTLLSEHSVQHLTTPFRLNPSQPHIAMDRRMRPIHRSRDIPVLDRIAPTIRHMAAVIRLIANGMFPKPPLPNARFALAIA